jgi:hypothetical protein
MALNRCKCTYKYLLFVIHCSQLTAGKCDKTQRDHKYFLYNYRIAVAFSGRIYTCKTNVISACTSIICAQYASHGKATTVTRREFCK